MVAEKEPKVDTPEKEPEVETYWDLVVESMAYRGLRGSPREIWLVYTLVAMDAFSYFGTSYILVLFLSNDFGFSDVDAGWIYGIHGVAISVYSIVLGCTVDVLGVRFTLLLGHALLMIARAFMTFTTSREVLLIQLYVVLPMGAAFLGPAMTTSLRRYTHDDNRSQGFSLYVVMMNVGALIAAPVVDIIRTYGPSDVVKEPGDLNEYRLILVTAWVSSLLSTFLTLFIREIDVTRDGEVREYALRGEKPWKIMVEIFSSRRFWKFMLFITLLMGVRFIFRHLDATFPKYMVRTFGEDVPFASILAINPFLVIFLVPAITPMTKFMSLYSLIFIGSSITALSALFMLLGPHLWCAVLFIVFLSIGESTWAPRLFEYSCMIAPKGREGTFMACASAPMFLAKLGVGGISGWLLTKYCPDTSTPENGKCDGFNLWLLVFLMTISSPILILLLKPVIASEGNDLVDENNDETEPLNKPSRVPDTRDDLVSKKAS